jgi:glucose/arabinose dehydrogenase
MKYLFICQKLLKTKLTRLEISFTNINGMTIACLLSIRCSSYLPATPGPNHPGGKLAIGLDDYLYTVIADLNNEGNFQNIKDGPDPDDSSVILKINAIDGSAAYDNPFVMDKSSNDTPRLGSQMDKYYPYGIRNSFGLAIDPVTGFLWDTENGDEDYDEMNLVRPGFNSGWKMLMGPISESDGITENDLVWLCSKVHTTLIPF